MAHVGNALDPIEAWPRIARVLPSDYAELANVHKQIQTQFGNAKITTADELLRFLFAYVQSNLPLRHTVAAIEAAGGPRLSAMRLHMKMRHAAPYLHALLGRLVPERELFAEGRGASFRGLDFVLVEVADVIGPGSTCTPARLHAVMRLADLRVPSAVLTDRSERDTLRRFMWSEGQVAVVHSINASATAIERLRAQRADVLVTLDAADPEAALPLVGRGGQPFVLADELATLDGDAAAEWPVLLTVQDPANPALSSTIEGRVCARFERGGSFGPERTGRYAVPLDFDAVAAPSPAPVVAVFTTVARATLSADALLDAHALAGRIGKATDGWRTPAGKNRLSNQRDDTTLAWLYAKMLLGILARRAHDLAA